MIVRSLNGTVGTAREVNAPGHCSRRLLADGEGAGLCLQDDIVEAGSEISDWDAAQPEAVYCIEGEGEVETLADGIRHHLKPGTVYAPDRRDRPVLRARTRMRLVRVAVPATAPPAG